MSLDADSIVDRRRIRRKLSFWRLVAALLVLLAVIAAGMRYRAQGGGFAGGSVLPTIARVKITGLIRNDDDRTESLTRLAKSNARAVIVHIDSPGGTTAGSEQLHDALREVAKAKPMVVVVDGLAASGGYIAAIASDQIIAQSSSLVGSIGVLFQYPNVTDLLKTIGVKVEEIKSSPLKAAPNGFEPTTPEARAAVEAIIRDSFDWFKGLVRERRHMDDATLARVSDGRVFTGRQGLDLHLVDQLGNEQTALEWLEKEKGVSAKTPVRDWRLHDRFGDFSVLHLATAAAFKALGLEGWARWLGSSAATLERLQLDGLLALWHPSPAN